MFDAVRWITFDAVGTLIFPDPSVGHVYARALAGEGIDAPPDALEARFGAAFGELAAQPRDRTDEAAELAFWQAVVSRTVEPWCPEAQRGAVFRAAYDAFARGDAWRAASDARPTLEALLARGYRLALLSNADSRFHRVLRELGLHGLFAHVFLSSELGHEKPDPRAFAHVRHVLGVGPSAILHVGDSARIDGEGARQAGWHALILGRDIRALGDLPALLP